MKILAIETSCDDTGVAVLEVVGKSFKTLSNVVASQTEIHKQYGGVFPAMAKREHQRNLVPTFEIALKEAGLLKSQNPMTNDQSNPKFQNIKKILEREPELLKQLIPFLEKYEKPKIDLVAVTNGPGLEPCLWVGVNFAKAISYFWDIPVVPANHIESHILVNFLNRPTDQSVSLPAIALVVSGGHTQLILMKKIGDYKILGETRDDAAGECFDKCAKILGFGYPGGPEIAKLAEARLPLVSERRASAKLPRPMINSKDYDFSFSGLKTAVLYSWQKIQTSHKYDGRHIYDKEKIEFAKEIQQAVIDVLLKKTIKSVKDFNAKTVIIGGGVSANQELRKQFKEAVEHHCEGEARSNLNLIFPPANLSTDNALMTAVAGYFHRKDKVLWDIGSPTKLKADANLRIGWKSDIK